MKVDAQGCKDIEEVKKSVVETLQNVPKKLLDNLVGSMGRRVQACINNKGGNTKYSCISL
jgi:hypothetical protein